MARIVVPHFPHHVTQRGNRRQKTFFTQSDYAAYIDLLVHAKDKAGLAVWAYCLMPNHVHLIVVPEREQSLRAFFADAHRRYTRMINFHEGWRGHLWQERFHSFVMDERHLLAAVRYTELNPVRAGLCKRAQDWPWSSVHAHLNREDDDLVSVQPMLERIRDWSAYLSTTPSNDELNQLRKHARTGRPMGSSGFIKELEMLTGKILQPGKPGPRRKN